MFLVYAVVLVFCFGEDGEIVEDEDEMAGIKRFSRESYKRIGPVLRRYYLNVPKNMPIKKSVEIDGQEYGANELSERDLGGLIKISMKCYKIN